MGIPAELAARTVFPGRVRQFAAPDPGQALALAVGSAWVEQSRGGHAVAVVPAQCHSEALVCTALALANRLGLSNLHLIPVADPALPCEVMRPREWQPVHLASLSRDLRPQWRPATPGEALDSSAADEPLLLLPARDSRWGCDRASLLALAWIAGDGRRVAWELPRGTPLAAWAAELTVVGRLQLPLKLLIDPADLPWPPATRGLANWWVAMPGTADAAGALAWALAGEELVLLAMPERLEAGEAWLPGSARRLAEGTAGTVLCTAERASGNHASDLGVLQLTSLVPLPLDALQRSAAPLLVGDEDLARHLAELAPRLRCTLAPPSAAPHS